MKIILASSNKGKIKEINQLMIIRNIEVIPQSEYRIQDAEESGLTFIENALIKARNAARVGNLPALADDSGLVVPALNGEPGIYSSRYAGEGGDHAKNINKLLNKLRDFKGENRKAYFYCVIVMLYHAEDPCPIICEGIWQGEVLEAPRGHLGFGYDPIFYDPTLKCAAAELAPEQKNEISHRGQAIKKLLERLG